MVILKYPWKYLIPELLTPFISKFSKRGNFLMKIRTLKSEIQQLKIQTMNEVSENIVRQSVTLFEKETHVESAGSLLYVHKRAKIVATITKLHFCTEEDSVLADCQNFSFIRYMTPIIKTFFFRNHAIAACNPL